MRRLALAAAVCGALALACNDQSPTEPAAPPAENFGTRCGPLVLTGTNGIAQQIANLYPGTARTQVLLRAAALAQAVAIKGLWDTCHPEAARKAAFFFIDWLNRHTPPGKETQVHDLIVAILRAVGAVPATGGDFGVGFFDPESDENTVITTENHHALIELVPGSFLVPTVIVVSRVAGDPPLTGFDGNQFPPTYDYNAINSTNTHALAGGHTAIVAFCLVVIGSPTTPGNGYPAGLAIGHNPFGGGFEILESVDIEDTELRNQLTCPGIDDVIGSAGGGLQNFANAALRTAGSLLLPPPLWASALGTLPPPPPLSGKAPSLSPFKPVEVEAESENQLSIQEGRDPSDHGLGSNYFKGGKIDRCDDGCGIRVQILDGEGAPTGAGTSITASLVPIAYPEGTTPVLGGGLEEDVGNDGEGGASYAEFEDLTISVPGRYKLTFSAEGATPVTSEEFDVYALEFTKQPAPTGSVLENTFLGENVEPFSSPVVRVAIIDYLGDLVAGAEDYIRVELGGADGGSLLGSTNIQAEGGEANFTQLFDPETEYLIREGLSVDIFEGCAGGAPPLTGLDLTASADFVYQTQSEPFTVDPDC